MKKSLLMGLLSFVLIIGVGSSAYLVYAHGSNFDYRTMMGNSDIDVEEMEQYMEEQGVDVDQMYQIMNSGNWDEMQQFMNSVDIDFDEMLPYMQKVHPNLDQNDLEDMYNDCHGTTNSSNSSYRGMMN